MCSQQGRSCRLVSELLTGNWALWACNWVGAIIPWIMQGPTAHHSAKDFGWVPILAGILHVISSAVLGFGGRKAVMSTPYWQAIRNLSWAKSNANEHHVVQGMYVRDKGIVRRRISNSRGNFIANEEISGIRH